MPQDTAREGIAAFIDSLRDLRDMETLSIPSRTAAAIHLQYFEQLVALELDPVIAMQILVSVTDEVSAWQDATWPESAGYRVEHLEFAGQFLDEREVPERLDLTGPEPCVCERTLNPAECPRCSERNGL